MCLTGSSSISPAMPMPALLTSTSRRPNRAAWRSTTAAMPASSAAFAATASTVMPSSRSRCAAACRRSSRREVTVSACPPRPSSRAMANPMPDDAPVTRAARISSR